MRWNSVQMVLLIGNCKKWVRPFLLQLLGYMLLKTTEKVTTPWMYGQDATSKAIFSYEINFTSVLQVWHLPNSTCDRNEGLRMHSFCRGGLFYGGKLSMTGTLFLNASLDIRTKTKNSERRRVLEEVFKALVLQLHIHLPMILWKNEG